MRFSDEQKEMLALLPNVKDIKTLRDASKLLLSYIIELYGMDFAKNNGYVFKTNKEVLAQTGIKQERTLIDAARELEMKGYITRTAGQRVKGEKNKASEYHLKGEMLQYALPNTVSNTVSNTALNTVSNTVSNTALNTVSKYDALLLKINELEERIKILETQNTALNTVSNTVSQNTVSQNVKYSTDTESDTESDTISKDNILNNNNTEGNNIKDQEKKKNISTVNLDKLKENSTVEIPNDEDIQRENEILNEIENTSKVKSSNNKNLNESRIPSDEGNISDNENPNDMPPLDVDSLFEYNSNPLTEYRTNENLNEENETSKDENPEDNEILEYSIFGDEIPQNNENSNIVKFIDVKFQVVEQVKDKINLNLSEMKNSKEKSQTIENVKTVKGEISNGLNSSKENENFNVFGKLQSYRDMNSGRVEGYQFNAYDNLTAAKDYSKSFHAAIINLTIESSDLKASVSDTGTWGMLSRKDGVYSFTASNTDLSDGKYIVQQRSLSLEKKGGAAADNENTSNNALQGDETSKVDNYTTSTEITAGNSVKMRPEPSDGNTDTTTDNKKDENTVESPSEDTPKTEIPSDDNDTPNNALQAPKTTDVDSNTTNTEKVDSTQSQITNKASNHNTDACYDMYGISTDELNDIIGHHHVNGKGAWRNMKIRLHNDETTISKALDHFKDKKEDGKEFMECNTFFYYFDPICFEVDRLHNSKQMTDEQFKDCCDIICKLTRGKTNYWHNTFCHRSPRPNFPSEKRMWELVGQPKVVNAVGKKSEVDNYTTSASKVDESSVKMRNTASYDNVVLPTHDDFKNMNLDDIHIKLLSFVNEHKNVSEKDKAYINNLCVAYALEPQYVA